ncbi:hypothetical protein ACRE_024690 [Hapsidospora chrysogenum ATCC 11550]|uniref:Uncharacterized protein n=1 Tax=Hapsidospora chrysogenum (strain ATCC 11550 / CBS 779.69 / DSM 880 / IAM 14645 / JCM 23072 / IMI 49137) TaxID=857340 RepID=A0A086TBG8_HAPC1|nr:hypothetical protein ACRE_024690 [Hapsidospora chrysogenum ATCC 11550]
MNLKVASPELKGENFAEHNDVMRMREIKSKGLRLKEAGHPGRNDWNGRIREGGRAGKGESGGG